MVPILPYEYLALLYPYVYGYACFVQILDRKGLFWSSLEQEAPGWSAQGEIICAFLRVLLIVNRCIFL